MKKINLVNPTTRMERLTQALAQGDKKAVNYEFLLIKQELNKQKRSAQYYLNQYDDARANVARAQLKSLNADMERIKKTQKLVNEYIRNPSKIRVNTAVANLNLIDKQLIDVRNVQRQAKETIVNIKHGEKVEILFTRVFMNNEVYNSAAILAIGKKIQKILPNFNLEMSIKAAFDVDKHFTSGDEQEAIINTAIKGDLGLQGYIERNANKLSNDEISELKEYYNELMTEMGAY